MESVGEDLVSVTYERNKLKDELGKVCTEPAH
jgi:hypothetical protein